MSSQNRLRVKLVILVALAVLLARHSEAPRWFPDWADIPAKAYWVSGWLLAVIGGYRAYGWRLPVLNLIASAPNLRGTWRIDAGKIRDLKAIKVGQTVPPAQTPQAYIVLMQSDARIRLHVLWDGPTDRGQVSEICRNTPAVAHDVADLEET